MRHERWLELAIQVARANPNERHKHGAVLVKGGSVLAVGLNTERAGFYPSRHAEWHAIREHLDAKAVLYVARVMRNGEVANSEPCSQCKHQIIHYSNVVEVYYTYDSHGAFGIHATKENRRKQRGLK